MLYLTHLHTYVFLPFGIIIGAGLILFLERKLIAMAQKRLGISGLGRQGWANLAFDVFKFWSKAASRHSRGLGFGALGALGAAIAWSVLGIIFLPNVGASALDGWDYQLLALIAYANLNTLMMAALIGSSRSKYATLAASRLAALGPLIELFFVAALFALMLRSGSAAVEAVEKLSVPTLVGTPLLGLALLAFVLFEAKRAPFDHTEAESELVAGHLVEFGGRTLLVFFVCEYIHVYFCVFYLQILVLGASDATIMSGVLS